MAASIQILRLVGATALDKRISILRLVGTTDLNKQIAILRLTGKTVSNPNNIYVQTPAGLRRGHLCYYDGTTIYKAV